MNSIDHPFFSIIIPTYNSAATIKKSLDSIKQQNFNNYEVWIIAGYSGDLTIEIASGYSNEINLHIVSGKDQGAYDAMNKGIALAKGEYLYFLGSDDTLYNENVLHNIAGNLLQNNASVLYGNVMLRGTNNWVKTEGIHGGEFNLKRLLSNNICHQSIFYHNSVFKKLGGYNLNYKVFADYDFNLKCFANYTFKYMDIIIANFHVGGISTQLTDEEFNRDKNKNVVNYFFKKLFTKAFVDSRLYVQQVALSKNTGIGFGTRLYCLLAYVKLKTQSLLH